MARLILHSLSSVLDRGDLWDPEKPDDGTGHGQRGLQDMIGNMSPIAIVIMLFSSLVGLLVIMVVSLILGFRLRHLHHQADHDLTGGIHSL